MAKRHFRLQYAKDTPRPVSISGVGEQVGLAFEMLVRGWREFLPLLIGGTILSFLTVGTNLAFRETNWVFAVIVTVILWMVSLYFARHMMVGKKVGFRDGLYNSMGPLIATMVLFVIAVVECIPVILLIVAYSAAIATDFLTQPFYITLFIGFAVFMVLITGYLFPTTLVAMVAVTAPGVYPWKALKIVTKMMEGRKIDLLFRLVVTTLVLALIWVIVMLPVIALKMPEMGIGIVVTVLSCFSVIYAAVYLYLYYKILLDVSTEKKKQNKKK